jgi:hypothetical protein
MALTPAQMEDLLEELKGATTDQLLLLNKHTADLFKLAQRTEGRLKMTQLEVGTKVMLSGTLRPQYLRRQLGEVVEIRDTRVTVKLDKGPMGKFRSGKVIMNPASLVILQNQPSR